MAINSAKLILLPKCHKHLTYSNVENIFTMYYILDIMLYLLAFIFLNNN